MERNRRTAGIAGAFALAIAFAGGCNISTEGALGTVDFTPNNCGRVDGCDFASGLGLGGTTQVQISGINGASTAAIDLASGDPEIIAVTPIADVGGRPTWELYGMGEGRGRLMAVDRDNVEVDFIDVDVFRPARLTMKPFLGNAVGPVDDPVYDERWTVNAGERVVMLVTPVASDDEPLIGRHQYVPFIEVEEFDSYINDTDQLPEGTLDFTASAGEYTLAFTDNNSASSISIVIVAEAVSN
ncbi:MAG: hypothetical protein MJE77_45145 [Proteobacteria bacterium]|nr:hypothetical protein [Pseudomonadota bacterium]